MLPARVEFLLEPLRKAPEGHTPGRIEQLGTPVGGNRENGTGLSEVVRPGKASSQGRRSDVGELPSRVPPLREVHLAEAGDHEADFQKSVQVDARRGGQSPLPYPVLALIAPEGPPSVSPS